MTALRGQKIWFRSGVLAFFMIKSAMYDVMPFSRTIFYFQLHNLILKKQKISVTRQEVCQISLLYPHHCRAFWNNRNHGPTPHHVSFIFGAYQLLLSSVTTRSG